MNRRLTKQIFALLVASLLLSGCLIDRIGGAFTQQPEALEQTASPAARNLLEQAFRDIDAPRLVDFHTHVLAIGTSAGDAFVNPRMLSGMNVDRLKFWIYESAAGIGNRENADKEYVARLVRLARATKQGGKYHLLAFDKYYN